MLNSDNIIKKINITLTEIRDDIKLNLVLPHVVALISEIINRNFDLQGAWNGNASKIDLFSGGTEKWAKLSNSTIKSYSNSRLGITPILYRTGNLKRNIEVGHSNNQIYISSNAPYSIFHQFGTKSIPARPFIVLSPDDLEEIYEVIASFLTR